MNVRELAVVLNLLTTVIGWPFFGQKLPAARARELFKPYTDSASLLVDIWYETPQLICQYSVVPYQQLKIVM